VRGSGLVIGLVVGLVVGAGAMYLVLRTPWTGGQSPRPPIDAGVAVAPTDAGAKGKKKRVRRPAGQVNAKPGPDEEFEDEGPALVQLTDADRRMEWRGEDVALPPRKIDMGSEARPLDDGEINNVLSSQGAAVRDCVVGSATNTDLRASITVRLVVDGNGRVTKSRVHAPRYLFEKGHA
jgi:hypothetical protein